MEPVRVLQIVPAMNCGGMENFIMNVYRCIDREQVQFDFLYHYADACFFDEEIERMGGRLFKLSVRNDNRIAAYCAQLDAFFAAHPEYRVIHGHYSGFGMFYNHYAKKHGVAVRAGHSHSDLYEKGLLGQLDRWMSKPFRYGLTDRFACSEAAGRFLFGSLPFTVLPNGIDAGKFAFDPAARARCRAEFGFTETDVVVGHVGRFDPVKNHGFLLEAFAQAAGQNAALRLLLTGDGALRAAAQRQAAALGIGERVVFAGLRRDTEACDAAADLFVLPSVFEGVPLSLVEAQASGLPCLASAAVNPAGDVTGNVRFLPLEQAVWAQAMADARPGRDGAAVEKIRRAGYDIRQTAAFLQNFYLEGSK